MADVQVLLARLQHDREFLLNFERDSAAAIAGYELTADQRTALLNRSSGLRAAVLSAGVGFPSAHDKSARVPGIATVVPVAPVLPALGHLGHPGPIHPVDPIAADPDPVDRKSVV